ncbi:MAG: phenylalanine--tRNA ligase beta subunit-related protein [Intestinibacter sp.]|uniref:B3/B4 domain-containing protein n=1 Tax=Intestinibacter sp. TaxID=1965304 RepID=UPI002A818564|nr:phenylalanine--tRNA ligase beta subunit-related protein [Intestinibacter sp.]MDY4573762.1 phenylalanine--tRNA ligase beta subunit-related protein [Intestinibacter sp.]
MKFIVEKEVFDKLDDVCFGIVVAKGIDNTQKIEKIQNLLETGIKANEEKYEGKKVKESEEVACYREAFRALGINPNKFMSSIEAMLTRVSKKKGLPSINPIVDIGNAMSLKYYLPMGAHDIDTIMPQDVEVRFSREGDKFIPFGETEAEVLDAGELVYAVGDKVRTRRWIWRQSEEGKIVESTKNIFFPIDGFKNSNYDNLMAAREELASLLKEIFDCEIKIGFIDKDNREFEID